MNCPFDGTALQPVKRQGVEIDLCPQCKGVWLERGELDKLIDLNSEATARYDERDRDDRYERPRDYSREYAHQQGHRPKKRKGFLSEMFDSD
jgi:Zn-finger nucleic acid-binding protein